MKKLTSIFRYKLTLVMSALLFSCIQVSAQSSAIHFGIEAGPNISGAIIKGSATSSCINGYQIGLTFDYAISKKFVALSGVSFITKGSQYRAVLHTDYERLNYDETYIEIPNYIQLPVYGARQIDISNNLNLKLGMGPYIAYGIGGTFKFRDNSIASSEFFKSKGYSFHKRLDFGLGTLVNLEYKHINLSARYEQGLANLEGKGYYGGYYSDYRNYCFSLSLGYKFGKIL